MTDSWPICPSSSYSGPITEPENLGQFELVHVPNMKARSRNLGPVFSEWSPDERFVRRVQSLLIEQNIKEVLELCRNFPIVAYYALLVFFPNARICTKLWLARPFNAASGDTSYYQRCQWQVHVDFLCLHTHLPHRVHFIWF